jgi:hypothetical protein
MSPISQRWLDAIAEKDPARASDLPCAYLNITCRNLRGPSALRKFRRNRKRIELYSCDLPCEPKTQMPRTRSDDQLRANRSSASTS